MEPTRYGDPVWSSEQAVPVNSLQSQLFAMGTGTAFGLGALTAASRMGNSQWNPIDTLSAGSRFAGDSTPFGLGNTFRVPEWLSPLTSPKAQGLSNTIFGLSKDNYGMEWDAQSLASDSSRQYLKKAFGLTEKQLVDAGLIPGTTDSPASASKLAFERAADSPNGRLYTIVNGQRKELASNVALMRASNEVPDIADSSSMNRAFSGVLRALNMWEDPGFNPGSLFVSNKGNLPGAPKNQLPDMIPVPSTIGSMDRSSIKGFWNDLGRRTSYVRGVSAFEMDRFNKLSSGLIDETMGPSVGHAFKSLTGLGLETLPGPASSTLLRIGGRVALAGSAYMAMQETDWWRRNYDSGRAVASGVVSTGVAAATYKLSGSSKASMFAGIASFAGQMLMPGFDRGIVEGVATTGMNAQILKAHSFNPVNYYRRALEGYVPGSTSFETSALLGIGSAAAVSYLGRDVFNRIGPQRLGLPHGTQFPESARDIFYKELASKNPNLRGASSHTRFSSKMSMLFDFFRQPNRSWGNAFGSLNSERLSSRKIYEQNERNNPINKAFIDRLTEINKTAGTGFEADVKRQFKGMAAQVYYSMLGANPLEEGTLGQIKGMGFQNISAFGKNLNIGMLGRTNRLFTVGLAAFGLHGLLSGGFLGSMKNADQLREEASGERLVEVKKSRWWEAGSQPWEGSGTSYFRPHAYNLMMNRAREKGIWGSDEDDYSPVKKFLLKNFTYELERKTYWDRPYPITSAAFSDVPIIGGLLGSTIGRLIKPARPMHASEWMQEGANGTEYMDRYQGARKDPAYNLGAYKPGIPDSPFSASQVLMDLSAQSRQLSGLTGWARSYMSNLLTGEDNYTNGAPVLANAGLMTSSRVRFLETQQGGGLFLNEAIRRIFPSYRSEIEVQNPIQNQMPSWLPRQFHYGDPMRLVEWGEARMPGAGYAALNPELQGVDPENYPLIDRFAILADIAPFTEEARIAQTSLYKMRDAGQTSQATNYRMDQITQQMRKRYEGFNEKSHDPNAMLLPGSSFTSSITHAFKKALRKSTAPLEYFMPMGFRPVMKLMGDDRDAIEQYEFERMYGSTTAFWDKHYKDWLRPAMYSMANLIGYEGKPWWRKEADANQQQFDQLEFVKYMKLAEQAKASGDGLNARRYMMRAASTRVGISGDASPLDLYWSLPDNEKKFFHEFSMATGAERDRILNMIPDDQARLYKAVWNKRDSGDQSFFNTNAKLDEQFLNSQYDAVISNMERMPPDDWIGYNSQVNIRDIRIKYLHEEGKELSDFGIWESEVKRAMAGAPYLDGSTDFMYGETNRGQISHNAYIATGINMITNTGGSQNRSQVNYSDNRDREIYNKYQGYANGY